MDSNYVTFLFDLEPTSPPSMPPFDDFITLLALPSTHKTDPLPLSPLDIKRLGPVRSPDLVSPVTLFSESEHDETVTHSPTLETLDPSALNSNPISYDLYSPLPEHYAEDSDISSRLATPCSMHSVPEPSSPSKSRSPSPSPSSASEFSPSNSRIATPEVRQPRQSKQKPAAIRKSRTPISVGRRSVVSNGSNKSWSEAENRACMKLMRQVCSEPKFQGKESRFLEVSRRMSKEYGFNRPNVKNQWNRYLRVRCGFEDRGEKKRGGGVVTSALGRKRKRAALIEDEDGQEEAEEDNDLSVADADDEGNAKDEGLDAVRQASTITNRTGWRPLGGKSYGGKSVPGYVPSPSYGGKSYHGHSTFRKSLSLDSVPRPAPRKTINTKSLSINTNNHSYTCGKTIWPSTEREAICIVKSKPEPNSPSSPSPSASDAENDCTEGSVADDVNANNSGVEDVGEQLPYLRRRLKRSRVVSDDSDCDLDGSDAEYKSPASTLKKRKIRNQDAAMAAELQRVWGLGLRRRG